MDQLSSVVMLWLSVTFGLADAVDLPRIRHVSPEQIAEMRYGGPGTADGGDVVAVYHDRLRTVFLTHGWDARDAADVSVLVHELVHHLQNEGSTSYACPAQREALAYEAQQRWLELFGQDLESAFGIDPLTLKVRTSCF